MREREPSTNVSRRDILKSLGIASFAAAPLLSGLPGKAVASTARNIAGWSRPVSIGVLLPQSNIAPSPSESFLMGMQLRLAGINREFGAGSVSMLTEDIGRGVGKAIGASRKLVENDGVDLVVGLMNPRMLHLISDTFESSRTALVVASTGECAVQQKQPSPYIFHCSLNQWQAHMAMGEWAAANTGRRAAVITSFHDSGYDTLPAFRRGFEDAGGEIISTHVIGVPNSDLTTEKALAEIAASRPDVVYALFSDSLVDEFVCTYSRSPLADNVPLFGSGLMVEEHLLARRGSSAHGIVSCFPWSEGLRTPENLRFMAAYKEATGRRADAYALLGYDTASLVSEALIAGKGNTGRARFLGALREASFVSPRGTLAMDPQTHSLVTPLYLRQSRQNGAGISNQVLTELPKIREASARKLVADGGARGGWLNSYISV